MMEKVSYPFQTQSKPTLTAPQCTPPSPDLTTRIDHALFLTDFGAGRVHRFMHHRHVLRGAPRFMEKVSCPVQTDFDGSQCTSLDSIIPSLPSILMSTAYIVSRISIVFFGALPE